MVRQILNLNFTERPLAKTLLVMGLSAALAGAGCSTNRMPGNGESSSGGVTPPPMNSSYRSSMPARIEPPLMTGGILTPGDHAAMTMASLQRVRVLGPSSPAGGAYSSDTSIEGLRVDPSYAVNARQAAVIGTTVAPSTAVAGTAVAGTPIVIGSVDDSSQFPGTPDLTAAVVVTPGGSVTASAVAPVAPGMMTPTTGALPLPAGVFAAGPGVTTGVIPGVTAATTISPTVSSGRVVPLTAASVGVGAANALPNMTSSSSGSAPATMRTAPLNVRARAAGDVRITSSASGRVVITNIATTRK